jgi:hypothetical protein
VPRMRPRVGRLPTTVQGFSQYVPSVSCPLGVIPHKVTRPGDCTVPRKQVGADMAGARCSANTVSTLRQQCDAASTMPLHDSLAGGRVPFGRVGARYRYETAPEPRRNRL